METWRLLLLDLMKVASEIHTTAISKGFWDHSDITPDVIVAKLALVHSEVSEILEAYRKQQGGVRIADEFADVLIRLLDLYEAMYIEGVVSSNLEHALNIKMSVNKDRPHKHNNLI